MTNRDRYILKRNEYDMLLQMQYNILDCGCNCVIDGLTGETRVCPTEMKSWHSAGNKLEVCGKCIRAWLNEEM
jgi:hypothetical protein